MSLFGMFGYGGQATPNATKESEDSKKIEEEEETNPFEDKQTINDNACGSKDKETSEKDNINIEAFESQLDIVQKQNENYNDTQNLKESKYEMDKNISREKLIEMANNLFGTTDNQCGLHDSTNQANSDNNFEEEYDDLAFEVEIIKRNSTITTNKIDTNQQNIIEEYIPHPPSPKSRIADLGNNQTPGISVAENEDKQNTDEKTEENKPNTDANSNQKNNAQANRFQSVINLGRSAFGFFGRKEKAEDVKEQTPSNHQKEDHLAELNECESEDSDGDDHQLTKSCTFEDSIVNKCREKSAPKKYSGAENSCFNRLRRQAIKFPLCRRKCPILCSRVF